MATNNIPISSRESAAKADVPVASLQTRINELDARFEETSKEIAKLQVSDRNWFKKAGIIIGVLAGAIAIPKAVNDAITVFRTPKPNTTVEWGKPLGVQYDVHNRVLRLEFPVLADNDGAANDSIEDLSATLHSDSDRSVKVLVGNSDIEVSDEGKSILQPIPIRSRQPRSLIIGLSLNSPFAEQVLNLEGRRTIDVVLKTHGDRMISRKYCFDFSKEQGQEVLAAGAKRVWTTECE